MPTTFKLTKPPDGLTRRVAFQNAPGWDELSAKIESLYGIPSGKAGVSYVDTDGDEVTLSSNEELQDYYVDHSTVYGKLIKFTVRDLSAPREFEVADKPLPHTPLGSNHRNTFGTTSFPMMFEVDNGWQRVPSLGGDVFMAVGGDSDAPHAFVEVLDSDVSEIKEKEPTAPSTVTESDIGYMPPGDKGKRKATVEDEADDDDKASIKTTLDEVAPSKPPMTSFASLDDIFGTRNTRASHVATDGSNKTATPKPQTDGETKQTPPDAPDPPLPDLEFTEPTPSASITNDVANLITAFSTVIASHPELSEGIRNIVRNATSGTYWTTHRESVARAAEEIRRSAQGRAQDARQAAEEFHRTAEEVAGARVAEAIGNIVRSIGEFTTAGANTAAASAAPAAAPAPSGEPTTSTPINQQKRSTSGPGPKSGPPPPPPPRPARRSVSPSRRQTWSAFGTPPNLHGHAHPPHHDPSHFSPFNRTWSAAFAGPPPPPPGRPPIPGAPPPHTRPRPGGPFAWMPPPPPPPVNYGTPPWYGASGWGHIPPPPPPPRPFGWHGGGGPTAEQRADESGPAAPAEDGPDEVDGAEVTMFGAAPGPAQQRDMDKYVPRTAREELQAAKEAYKAQKEKYRQEREMHRKQMGRVPSGDSSGDQGFGGSPVTTKKEPGPSKTPAAEMTQIISNARGPYPQLEMFSVPRRSHTIGHRPSASTSAPPLREGQSILNRLGDMGFTTTAYPSLHSKLQKRLPKDKQPLSKSAEDEIVMQLIEELLSVSPQTQKPQAPQGPSNPTPKNKDRHVPGAFH